MESILYNISQVLGITIIHSLWQGLLIYFILRLALMFSANLTPSTKYFFAIASLLAITGCFVYTLINEINLYNWITTLPAQPSAMPVMIELPGSIRFNDQSIRYYYSIAKYLPYITIVYVSGLIFNTSRLIIVRNKINSIKQSMSIDIALQLQADNFREIFGIAKKVRIGLSKLVDVPCMTGYIKPVILLPFTLSAYLSVQEIESILLHELAHIKRNDYMVNMLQQVISILLFFNPCALLINRIINEERENCCDDLVVKATADPIIYAKALLKLEQTRQNDWKLALAATGKKYHLLTRIERIMKTKKPTPSLRPALLAMLILTAGIGLITLLSPEIAHGKISVKAITPAINSLMADTNKNTAVKKTKAATSDKKVFHQHKKEHYISTDDKRLQELTADINKHSEALSKYYSSDAFKATQQELEKKGKEMQELYNSAGMKKLQEDMAKASADFAKDYSQDDKLKDMSALMGEKGRKIGIYYSSPEFKKMNEELEKKYGIPHDHYYFDDNKDENYRKYQAELESRIPADVKLQQDDLKKMGEQMSARYQTPEFKAKTERMKIMADSMQRAYQNPMMKEQQREMEKLAKQMTVYQNSAQIKREKELLGEAVRKMTAYINSTEYKNYINQFKKMNFNYNYNFNDSLEKPEKPEKPEPPEKVEKPEKPEPPEQPVNSNR